MIYVLRRFVTFQDGTTEKNRGLHFWVFGLRFIDTRKVFSLTVKLDI